MKKFIKVLFIAIPVLIIAAFVALYLSFGWITKKAVETLGPDMTQTEVKLEESNISLLSGKGVLRGVFVGNPEGFKTESAFKLKEVKIVMQVPSIISDRIIIDEIVVRAPEITYEMMGSTNNIKTILGNIKSFTAQSRGKTIKGPNVESKTDGGKKLQINNFIVKNGRVNMSMDMLNGKKLSMTLPDIHLKNIGAGKEGKTASEVFEEIFRSVNEDISNTVSGSTNTFKQRATKTMDTLKDKFKKLFGK